MIVVNLFKPGFFSQVIEQTLLIFVCRMPLQRRYSKTHFAKPKRTGFPKNVDKPDLSLDNVSRLQMKAGRYFFTNKTFVNAASESSLLCTPNSVVIILF